MSVTTRFAPSPTGHVHIGNIRTAIFAWLFARHSGGRFLLRVEDTDRERSTQAAIDTLLACMDWLGLDHDGGIYYQSQHAAEHAAAAARLLAEGKARLGAPDASGARPILFRIPWDGAPCVREAGWVEMPLHPGSPLRVSPEGVAFATASPKGKPVEAAAALAGFRGLQVFSGGGSLLFDLERSHDAICAGETASFEDAARVRFLRREAFFEDLVKGPLSKPLDGMKDLVALRGDGTPVFHLANVCDDIAQGVTHIIRGDDHVENTYRHILLFHALGAPIPAYAHLPMIVNQAGKPYSKRDGDAFVGDFKAKGILPEALFNFLALLGWSPGDGREKMDKAEMAAAFSLDRVRSAPAQFDGVKLASLNGLYIAETPFEQFRDMAMEFLSGQEWAAQAPPEQFSKVAKLMQSRVKVLPDILAWRHFFEDFPPETDAKAFDKLIRGDPASANAIRSLLPVIEGLDPFDAASVERAVRAAEEAAGLKPGKLNQPLRVALTGLTIGAGIYETMEALGRKKVAARLQTTLAAI